MRGALDEFAKGRAGAVRADDGGSARSRMQAALPEVSLAFP